MNELFDNSRWFVAEVYSVAGRPKMEEELMDYAKGHLLHRIINTQAGIRAAMQELLAHQSEVQASGKRWLPVNIYSSMNSLCNGELCYIYIGQSSLTLRLVKGEI